MYSLKRIATLIDGLNEQIGRWLSWLALAMVLVQFIVVLMRYVFGVGSIMMQESVVYMHGILFMVGAGYTLLHDGHVRVDVFYHTMAPRWRALINFVGVFLFLLPVAYVIFETAWPYVMTSWATKEGSRETSGIQGIYLLKTVILIFCVLISLQGLSLAIHSLLQLLGLEESHEEKHEEVV